MQSYKIILFDGICNLCNSSVNFIIDRDRNDIFKFASFQSDAGKTFLNTLGLDSKKLYSVILIDEGTFYTKSTAALKIIKEFGGFWKPLYAFIMVPKMVRDLFYDVIANNRYRWFGRTDSCRVPNSELQERFL